MNRWTTQTITIGDEPSTEMSFILDSEDGETHVLVHHDQPLAERICRLLNEAES